MAPQILFTSKTAGSSMDIVKNAQKMDKMAALNATLLLLLDMSSEERDDAVHRAIKVEMSIQGNVCSPKKRHCYK